MGEVIQWIRNLLSIFSAARVFLAKFLIVFYLIDLLDALVGLELREDESDVNP